VIEDHRAASGSYNARYMGDVCHERKGEADVEGRPNPMWCCAGDGGRSSGGCPAGGGFKPPQAALVKSQGGERCRKGVPL